MFYKYLIKGYQKLICPEKDNNHWQIESIKQKDILTLEEAALYLDIQPGILLEEVGLGKIPGGKLVGQWRFSKEALFNHFSIYHGMGPWIEDHQSVCHHHEPFESCSRETVKKLREDYQRGQRDFSDMDLRAADLSGIDLSEADFTGSWLSRANLQNTKLTEADFENANLRHANLKAANLSYANLKGADLTEADLSQAILVGASLENAILLNVNLWKANIEDARFK